MRVRGLTVGSVAVGGTALLAFALLRGPRRAGERETPVVAAVAAPVPADSTAPVPAPPPPVAAAPRPSPPTTMPEPTPPPERQDTARARYPREWEVSIPPGTRLDSLRHDLDSLFAVLPPNDLEDRSPLPVWFRVYLRRKNPGLPTQGPYQYPRAARTLLRWMVAHPDSVER